MRFSLLVAILLINCSTLERAEYGNTRSGYPDQESWGVKITLTDEGVMRALVKSGHLEKFNDRQYILLDKDVDVDFFDVINVTESKSESGRTSIPGKWTCNINYRYAPGPSMQEAEIEFSNLLASTGFEKLEFTILDHVPSAQVIETELLNFS